MNPVKISTLADGSRGFDCNQQVSSKDAAAFYHAGYRFAVRYVRRQAPHSYDISTGEVLSILNAGLGLMLVQHVAQEGLLGSKLALGPLTWSPNVTIGHAYGAIAANEAAAVGYPRGAVLWCDLEGVALRTPAADVIAYCNAWYDAARDAGFIPGLYVGFDCGLSADQLYYKLKYSHYWAAYNLNKDSYPSVRNVEMQQLPYPAPAYRVPGISYQYDGDVIRSDKKGGSPLLLLPK